VTVDVPGIPELDYGPCAPDDGFDVSGHRIDISWRSRLQATLIVRSIAGMETRRHELEVPSRATPTAADGPTRTPTAQDAPAVPPR
jgi:hypothetical protein